jgi:hypothetical protein
MSTQVSGIQQMNKIPSTYHNYSVHRIKTGSNKKAPLTKQGYKNRD